MDAAGVGYAGTASSRHAADIGARSGLIPPPPAAAPRGINPSAFGSLDAAVEHAYATRNRIERIVERLAGVVPEAGIVDKPSEPNGLLDAATRQACDISANMRRISDALDRLESQLP